MSSINTVPNTGWQTLVKTAMAVTAGLSLSFAVGCSNSETAEEEVVAEDAVVAETSDGEVVRIATEGAYAPFNYTDASGNLVGFDVDLVNALCDQMQTECEVVAQDWDGIIPGLKAGKYDAIIAGMSITPDRQEQVDFTDPYFSNSLVYVAKEDSGISNTDPASLGDLTIGTQRATVASQWIEDNLPDMDAKYYDTLTNAFLDLESGRIDLILSDKAPAIEWLSTDKTGYNLVGDEIDINDTLGIAVRKGDGLKGKFDTALSEIKANGVYDSISNEYFSVK